MDLRKELPYRVDYANYDDEEEVDVCNACHEPIEEDSLRFAVEKHSFRKRTLIWHHFSCFFDRFRPRIQEISHFAQIKYNDQKRIKTAIKRSLLQAINEISDQSEDNLQSNGCDGSPQKKKRKTTKKLMDTKEKDLKKQSNLFYENLRFLETMETEDMIQLMDFNHIEIPLKRTSKWDRLADAMTFGRLVKCGKCKKGQLVFRICGYICSGYGYELNKKRKWFRCDYQTTDIPERKPFKIPKQLSLKYDYLKNFKFKPRNRIYIPSLVRINQQMVELEALDQ